MDKQWAAEIGDLCTASAAPAWAVQGNRGYKEPGSCLGNILCITSCKRLNASLHTCNVDIQVSMPFPPSFSSPLEQPFVVTACRVGNLTSTNAIPFYSLCIINILLWKPVRKVCRAAPPADAGSGRAKHSYLYSETGIYCMFNPLPYYSPFGFASTLLKASSIEVLHRTVLTDFNSEVPRPSLLSLQRLILVPLKGT